jgi:hypothetical protein
MKFAYRVIGEERDLPVRARERRPRACRREQQRDQGDGGGADDHGATAAAGEPKMGIA